MESKNQIWRFNFSPKPKTPLLSKLLQFYQFSPNSLIRLPNVSKTLPKLYMHHIYTYKHSRHKKPQFWN